MFTCTKPFVKAPFIMALLRSVFATFNIIALLTFAQVQIVVTTDAETTTPQVETRSFQLGNASFVAHLARQQFIDAVSACNSSSAVPTSRGVLVPLDLLPWVLMGLSATRPDVYNELKGWLTNSTSSDPFVQEGWSLWVWDRFHVCQAAKYVIPQDGISDPRSIASSSLSSSPFIQSMDRPCTWNLSFICMPESQLFLQLQRQQQDDGVMDTADMSALSSAHWYQIYTELARDAPSTYRLGPQGSGLELVYSDVHLASGDVTPYPCPQCENNSMFSNSNPFVSFNQSADFWSSGPVVSALFRGSSYALTSLKVIREDDIVDSWLLYQNQSRITECIGACGPDIEANDFEAYNVGPFNDFIVSTWVCYKNYFEIERLFFTTRTGRQYQLGRGPCTEIFREDAPPGGYLAGFVGRQLDVSALPNGSWQTTELLYRPVIQSLQLIWAAPRRAVGDSSNSITVPQHIFYRSALKPLYSKEMAWTCVQATKSGTRPSWSGPETNMFSHSNCGLGIGMGFCKVCATNKCCGTSTLPPLFRDCSSTEASCKGGCLPGFGLCGVTPEQEMLLFVRTSLDDTFAQLSTTTMMGRPTLYFMTSNWRTSWKTYSEAQAFCRASTLFGLRWDLIEIDDAIGFGTALSIRAKAYGRFTGAAGLPFWIKRSDSPLSVSVCMLAMYGVYESAGLSRDLFPYTFWLTSCGIKGLTICKAQTDISTPPQQQMQSPPPLSLQTTTTTAQDTRVSWRAGPHKLEISSRIGNGPLVGSCFTTSLYDTGGQRLQPNLTNSSRTYVPSLLVDPLMDATLLVTVMDIYQPLSMLGMSMAIASGINTTDDSTEQVLGLRIMSTSSEVGVINLGDINETSLNSWDLSDGEVVTAVSGCAGGYIERLVFHTSAGRLITSPYTHLSLCSVYFMKVAPEGGYMVGFQGFHSYFLDSLHVVWGTPLGPPGPMPPPPPPSSQQSPGTQQSDPLPVRSHSRTHAPPHLPSLSASGLGQPSSPSLEMAGDQQPAMAASTARSRQQPPLSRGAVIGISVSGAVGGVVLVAAGGAWLLSRYSSRRKYGPNGKAWKGKDGEESGSRPGNPDDNKVQGTSSGSVTWPDSLESLYAQDAGGSQGDPLGGHPAGQIQLQKARPALLDGAAAAAASKDPDSASDDALTTDTSNRSAMSGLLLSSLPLNFQPQAVIPDQQNADSQTTQATEAANVIVSMEAERTESQC